MSPKTQSLSFRRQVKAPRAQVYLAFTNATVFREWMCDVATTDPKPGGRVYFAWNGGFYACGEFVSLQPEEQIKFTWHGKGEPAPSLVTINLSEQNGSTLVNLVQEGLDSGEAWEGVEAAWRTGWERGLENLASVIETGEDIRFVRRPMLGITIDEFNPEIAKKLGVPVNYGIRLAGVVEGMGAKAAGLKNDDVIVQIGKHEIRDYSSLANVLGGQRSGDEVEVTFYRGPEKKTTPMKLSGRPIPQIPDKAQALAELTDKRRQEIITELNAFLDGVSEEEASYKPGAEEWSVKEVIAHLIHGEYGFHNWISDTVGNQEPWYDDYGGNLYARVNATVKAFPSKKELLTEYDRSMLQTVYLLENLPDSFVSRKGGFWRLAYNVQETPYHYRSHKEQMETALMSARGT